MENSTVRRAIVLVVLITCSILLLSWVVDRAAENAPDPTPTASVTATASA
ncbi:hypothetical protein [Demequina sp.]